MPVMIRQNKKAEEIAWNVLNKPANLKSKRKTKREKRIEQSLQRNYQRTNISS